MSLTLDAVGLAPVTTVAGTSLPPRWALHPVVVAEHGHHGWDATDVRFDDDAFVVRLRWRERTDGERPFAVERDLETFGVSVLALGEPEAVARFLVEAGPALGRVTRASVPRGTRAAIERRYPSSAQVPAPFDRDPAGAWDWFGTIDAPAAQPGEGRVVELTDAAGRRAAATCLAVANPDGELSVDEPRSRWWGWRDDDGVLRGVTGASRRVRGQPWVLGSIGTDPAWRGRGIAAATTAAATRAGLDDATMVTLGVYTHNEVAGRLYRRLGFTLVQQFESWRP